MQFSISDSVQGTPEPSRGQGSQILIFENSKQKLDYPGSANNLIILRLQEDVFNTLWNPSYSPAAIIHPKVSEGEIESVVEPEEFQTALVPKSLGIVEIAEDPERFLSRKKNKIGFRV